MKDLLGKSIGHKLLKAVFSLYFIVTVILTSGHLYREYLSTKNSMVNQLNNIGNSFEDSLQTSLWELNSEGIESVLNGITKTSIVSGAAITDADGNMEATNGQFIQDDQRIRTVSTVKVGSAEANEIQVDIDGSGDCQRTCPTLASNFQWIF